MIAVLAVAGPTGSGKTALALELAERIGTEIVSADAMQFYQGMEIGTAAPTVEERAQVPHHFVAFQPPDARMDAGAYARHAREVVAGINARGVPAVVVGGSGLYLSALIDDLFDGPGRNDPIRERLKQEAAVEGNAALAARLQAVDPEYAAKLTSENDLVRIVRALEVYEAAGVAFSKLHAEHRARAQALSAVQVALDWDRAELYARIGRRVDAMVAQGWVDEVRALMASGYGPQIDRLKALGYREVAAALRGEKTMDEAIEATKQHHRRYAKRQLTWFRADPRIHWIKANNDTAPTDLAEQTLALYRGTAKTVHGNDGQNGHVGAG